MRFMYSIAKAFILSLLIVGQINLVRGQTTTTASILPPAKTTFNDQNGKPLSFGSVGFFIPGTMTQKTTWQDIAETIPNLNPVILDSAGRALILGSGSYRQIVNDRHNNLIWDQVTSSPSGGSSGPTATGDGDLVGTIKPWAGLTAPNQYMFAAGAQISRALFPALFTAITSVQNVTCTSGNTTLNGLTDTTSFWIGMTVEVPCLAAGHSTITAKTSTSVTLAGTPNASTNVVATFFPWGNGNGTTTFTIPDLRGAVIAGNNNMGGNAGTLLTTSFFGATNPNSVGALGGSQSSSTTLLATNLPPITSGGTFNGNQSNLLQTNGGTFAISAASGSQVGNIFNPSTSQSIIGTPTASGTVTSSGTNSTPIVKSIVQPTETANYIIKVTPDSNSATASGVTSLGSMTGDIGCGIGVLCTGNIISVDATLINTLLTGYASSPGTVTAADSILTGIEKVDGNDQLKLPLAGGTMTGSIAMGGSTISGGPGAFAGLTATSSFTATGLVTFADMASAALATAAQYMAATAGTLVASNIAFTSEVTTTFGTTTSLDFNTFINTAVTLTGNITTMNVSNVKAGQSGMITFIQDGTGSRTTVFNSIFKFSNGTVPSLSSAAAAVDVLTYSCRSATFCVASLLNAVQ